MSANVTDVEQYRLLVNDPPTVLSDRTNGTTVLVTAQTGQQ